LMLSKEFYGFFYSHTDTSLQVVKRLAFAGVCISSFYGRITIRTTNTIFRAALGLQAGAGCLNG